jgi:succinate dehydrogenase/fumarate reductase cytochrome b subunit
MSVADSFTRNPPHRSRHTVEPEVSTRLEAPRWPARLDLLQSGTGLALGLFMWVHMFFVSSILLGKDVM